jgi:hypothetical protein
VSPNDRGDKILSWLLRLIVVTSLLLAALALAVWEPESALDAASTAGVAFLGLMYRSAWVKAHAKPAVTIKVTCSASHEEIAAEVQRELALLGRIGREAGWVYRGKP